jgi:ketosteroid isomerase-like protein
MARAERRGPWIFGALFARHPSRALRHQAMKQSLPRISLLAGLLVSGLLACAAPAASDSRDALEAAIQHWTAAVNAQDATTLTRTMTEDVELTDDTATVTGRDAAVRALRELVARGKLITTTREITVANDVAWHVVGLAQAQKNGDVQARGQALEIWKHVNGEWRLHRRVATGTVAPEISPTRPAKDEPVLDRVGE